MDNNIDNTIRDYAEGALTGNDLQAFEHRLKNESELQTELDLYLALKAMDNQRLKKQLSDAALAEQLSPQVPAQMFARRFQRWLAVAASLAILLIAGWWYFQGKKVDAVQLAQTYIASPYPSPVATMGVDTLSVALQRAFMAYRNDNFAAAALQLTALAASEESDDEMLFYTGEAMLQTGQWELAINYFDRVQPGYWREIADWRCALAMLKSGQTAKARSLLEKLRSGARREQAETLLKAME